MTGLIKGNDVLFLVDKGDGYVPFVCAKDLSIETTTSLLPVATIGDGEWDKFRPSSLGYSVNVSGVVRFSDADMSAFDIVDYQNNMVPLLVKVIFTDQEDNNQKTFKGQLLVERSNLSGNAGAFALADFTLRGSGKYQIISCASLVGTVTTENLFNGIVHVVLSEITGSPTSYIYQLDTGFEQESDETDFNLFNVTGGEHTLIVTPVCAGGSRGESVTYDFTNVITVDNPFCGMPSGVTITNITTDGFKVNWIYGSLNTSVNIIVKNTLTGAIQNYLNKTGASFTLAGQQPSTLYEVTVQGYCGVDTLSGSVTVQATTARARAIPRITVNNATDTVTVTRVSRGGTTIFGFSVAPHTNYVSNLLVDSGDFAIEYTSTAGDGSIQIITSYQNVCQPVVPSTSTTNTFTTITSAPGDITININPNLCP